MKSTFRILFYLKRDKQKLDGTAPIWCRITVDGLATRFSTKSSILPDLWDAKTGRATGKEAATNNRLLDEINANIYRVYYDLQLRENNVTAERIKNVFLGIEVNIPDGHILKLQYRSHCQTYQKLDFLFADTLGNTANYTIEFTPTPYPYYTVSLPFSQKAIKFYETVEMNFTIEGIQQYEANHFKFKFTGGNFYTVVSDALGNVLVKDYLYSIPDNGKLNLKFRSNSSIGKHELLFTFDDGFGNQVTWPVTFSLS